MFRLTFIACFFATFVVRAADVNLESGPQRVHVIELFTSQGCSSCPPAEAWLSKLKSERGLWKDFVPLAFHVDYWDHLGWRDPFASKEWTARQYQYSANWKSESVYTPGFVLDGREWTGRSIPAAATEKVGEMKVTIENQKLFSYFITTKGESKDLDFHIAQLGFDLTTKVSAGENSGRNLKQDFVVLSLANARMPAGRIELVFNPDSRASAIVAWVTLQDSLEPIQAVGGWIR